MPIQVAHVMRTYGVNGGERQLAQLFKNSDQTVANTFISVYRDNLCDEFLAGIEKLRLENLSSHVAPNFLSLRREMLALLVRLPLLQVKMLLALRRGRYEICVAHGVQAAFVCWLSAVFLRSTKFVYIHRGAKSAAGSHPVFRLLYTPFDAVAGVSKASAASLAPLVPDRQVIAIENGVDWRGLEARTKKSSEPLENVLNLICIGRLMPDKGQQIILEAFALLAARHPEARLAVIGGGPDRDMLAQLAANLGIAAKIDFHGHVDDVPARLANSDIFVHASRSEGLSNAVLEAMALGLPSVVGAAPGVSECHIDGETGFVVDRNPIDFAQKQIALADDPALRRRLGEAAAKRVHEVYSIEANRSRYHDLYTELLGKA